MTDTQTAKAFHLAEEAHRGQTDKAGAPYIEHPRRVSARCTSEAAKTAALLHDVVEDTPTSIQDLRDAGFSPDVIAAVDCLTKREDEDYLSVYLPKIGRNPIAREVKLCDLEDNLDIKRLPEITEKDLPRLNKYLKAYRYLKSLPDSATDSASADKNTKTIDKGDLAFLD